MWKACLVAAVLASCFIKPGPPGVGSDGSPTGDAGDDDGGITPDGPTLNCMNPNVTNFRMMTLTNSCGAWATKIGSGSVNANLGPLMLATGPSSIVGCSSNTLSTGAYIHLTGVPMPLDATMFLEAKTLANQVVRIQLMNLSLTLDGSPAVPFNLNMMPYWRLHFDGPHELVGEYSDNAMTWHKLGTVIAPNATTDLVTMSFAMVTQMGGGSAAVAEYAACP